MKNAVLITAATKRIGLALTKHSLEKGLAVIAHYRTSASPLKSWLSRNPKYKKNTFFIKSDLQYSTNNIIKESLGFGVNLVGLINNASTFSKGNLTNFNNFNDSLNINALIPLELSTLFYKNIKEGWIINITDANIKPLNKNFQNYRISKILLTELTKQLALSYAPKIRVNAIAPGAVLQAPNSNKNIYNKIKKSTPLPSKNLLDTVLNAYDFIRENKNITGQTIFADSGRHLQ